MLQLLLELVRSIERVEGIVSAGVDAGFSIFLIVLGLSKRFHRWLSMYTPQEDSPGGDLISEL